MLHDIINKQGNCLGSERDILEKKYYFSHVFQLISTSGALVLVITIIAGNKPMELLQMLYIIFFITYFLMPILLKYIDI